MTTSWTCDVCGEDSVTADNGYVVWDMDRETMEDHSFSIIHQSRCDDDTMASSSPLAEFLGPDGLANLTSLLSLGPVMMKRESRDRPPPKDMTQFIDFFRRLQLPGYEQARPNFQTEVAYERLYDASELYPYLQTNLDWIADLDPDY